ncbi:MAG TPA: hypothetical protein VNA04_16820 [Thermoanaerobaculia bacterium]|nr:hypothetical protein [Thermoanaerobaculia bacterium]
MIKLVFDPGDLRLLGVHIVGENASELLHTGMMVMQFGGTIKAAAYDGLGNVSSRRLGGSAEAEADLR